MKAVRVSMVPARPSYCPGLTGSTGETMGLLTIPSSSTTLIATDVRFVDRQTGLKQEEGGC
ncbi:MAG: hypothetical protein SV686_07850 [Thermodesulfobacteriota bacterium]|nr:hypothetical protein [Thermodesulfobacteriota bacterium]